MTATTHENIMIPAYDSVATFHKTAWQNALRKTTKMNALTKPIRSATIPTDVLPIALAKLITVIGKL